MPVQKRFTNHHHSRYIEIDDEIFDYNDYSEACAVVMPFGLHAGKVLGDIPHGYLYWMTREMQRIHLRQAAAIIVSWRGKYGV